jgi:hypothetical protein
MTGAGPGAVDLPPNSFAAWRAGARGPAVSVIVTVVAAVLAAGAAAVSLRVQPLYGLAVAYVAVFWCVAWRWPHVALALIFASAPFQTDVSGGGGGAKFSITELSLALALPVFYLHGLVRRVPVVSVGPMTVPVLCYFAVCALASWQNWLGKTAFVSLFQMTNYLLIAVAMFASFAERRERNLLALNSLVFICFLLALYKLAGLNFLGLNKNGIGASLSCGFVVCLELWFGAAGNLRRQRVLLTALLVITTGMILTLSRGAWLSAAVGLCMIFTLRREFRLLTRVALVLVPLIAICWSLMPKEDREYATTFDKKNDNIRLRYESLDIAREHWEKSPVYGDGVGWRKLYDATNTPMLLLAETGVLGLAAFGALHGTFLSMAWRTHRRLKHSDPLFSFVAVGAALVLGKGTHGLVDHYWSRGAVTLAWAGAGLALGAYYEVQQRDRAAAAVKEQEIG